MVAKFITALYNQYVALHFTYMEINLVVVTAVKVYIPDLAAKLRTHTFFAVANGGKLNILLRLAKMLSLRMLTSLITMP